MHAINFNLHRGASLLACLALALGSVGAQAATAPKEADAFPTFDSYIKISGQAASITGNEAAFQKRIGQPKSGGVGIEDLHFNKDLGNDTTMVIDGRALTGSEDYLAKLNLTKNEVGSFELGYKSFRTFYDGIGGFFPLNNRWNALNSQDLHIDRGTFWAEAKINRPNMPEFEFRFEDGTRTGKKDSLVWGDSDFTGLPNNNPPISQVRKMDPSYRKLDEHHQNFEATMRHSAANTTYSITLMHEKTDDSDTRYGTRFPGEAKPFPTPASTTLLPPEQMNNQVQYSQTDGMVTKMSGVIGKTDTTLTEKVKLLTGFNYQDLKSDFTGDRPLFTTTPTAVGNVIAPSNNYLNLMGGSKVKVYVGTIAVEFKPTPFFFAKAGFRGEDKRVESSGELTSVAAAVNTTTGIVTITPTRQIFNSRIKEKSLTPSVDLSYTGIKSVTLYASGTRQLLTGDERYTTPFNPLTASNGTLANNDQDDNHEKYNVGFNWTQSSLLTLRGELFHKHHVNKSLGYGVNLGDNYVLGYKFNGMKLTAIVKPTAQVSLTGRYVYQKGTADVTGFLPTFPTYDSMDAENHMLGGSIDWNPNKQFYSQLNVNLVYNVVKTLDGRGGITVGTPPNASYSSDTVLKNSDNNYMTASFVTGAVLTKEDDLQVRFSYYKADNYNPQVASLTMPYGAGAKEYSVTVGLKHKFSDRCMGNAKIGYYDAKNDTTGGNTNFKGPLAYVSLDYAL